MNNGSSTNTDREIWRQIPGDYYSPSIHVTANGGIGINVSGRMIVLPARAWHALAGGQIDRLIAPPSDILQSPFDC